LARKKEVVKKTYSSATLCTTNPAANRLSYGKVNKGN
jgi:hypothetical protein